MSNEDLIREMANLNITPRLRQDDQDEDNGNIHHQDEHENFEEEPDNNQMLAARIELLSQTLASTLNQRKTVRFDEVEKTFRRFSGNSHENFNNWLTHFEEQCLLYELNSREQFIFSKRLMIKDVKSYIEYESKAKNYLELKQELSKEFGQTINSAIIHQKLRERKKKKEESFTEYFYEMLSLASHSNIDHAAIITYTIEGLPGTTESKAFMYEAETISQFKKKLHAFEIMNAKFNKPKTDYRQTKNEMQQDEQRKCYNCGGLHNTFDCPNKANGPKCFTCNQYGHKSTGCFNTKPEEKGKINIMRAPVRRPTTQVKLNNRKIKAHIDSQSDFNVIQEDVLKKNRIPVNLKKCSDEVKGVGGLAPLTGK